MSGRTKDSEDSRQDKGTAIPRNDSADLLLSRLKDLMRQINLSFSLIQLNMQHCYVGATFAMDEANSLRQQVSEFIGLLCYMQAKHKETLLSCKADIDRMKLRLGMSCL